MAFIQALILGLIALILLPGYGFYFDVAPKVAVLLAGTAVLLVLAARSRDLARGPRLLAGLLLLNTASLAFSTGLSTNRALSLFGGTWREFGALVQAAAMLFAWLVARTAAGRPDRVRTLLRGIAMAGTASAAYGLAQYFGWDPLIPRASYRIGEGIWAIVRPPGTLGYASYFATWLLMTVFLSLELEKMETGRGWRWMARAAAALSLAAMLATGTRAALVGLAAGFAVWMWRSGFRLPRRAVAAAMLVAALGAGFYISPAGQQLRSRTRWFREDPWGGARLLLWRDSLRMAARRPIAGYGPEVFLAQFPRFESKALAEAYPDFMHESPHNILLDALLSQGLPGLALLAALCAAGLAAAWRRKAGWLTAALAAGLVSQQFTAFTMPTAVLFLATIALAMGMTEINVEPRRSPALPAAAPLLVLGLLYFAVRITVADHALARTRQLMDAREYVRAGSEYQVYWRWRLPGSSADLWYARSWMDVAGGSTDPRIAEQAIELAEQAAARATQNDEEPFAVWYTLAEIAALHEDYRGTESGLQRAVEAHPNWFKPHWMLAQQMRLMSRRAEAGEEAALAAELDGGHHPEVARTLAEIQAGR